MFRNFQCQTISRVSRYFPECHKAASPWNAQVGLKHLNFLLSDFLPLWPLASPAVGKHTLGVSSEGGEVGSEYFNIVE